MFRTARIAVDKPTWVGRAKTRAYLQRSDVKRILEVTEWPEQKSWQADLPNPSGVTLPLRPFQLARAAFIPAIIMVLVRPALVFTLLLACAFGCAVWHLLSR